MLPHGFGGRVFGFLMERVASSNYRWVINQLKPANPQTYLELGFGTGKLPQLVAAELRPACICGVDPSELMFERASRRLKRFTKAIEIDLRLGNDADLPWAEGSFDAIVASHNFQFWYDPIATLARVRKLIRANGRLIFVVRNTQRISRSVRRWIPNPITKSGKELEGLRTALTNAGFRVTHDVRLRSGSRGIIAECA
jgi:ubiquinone/menaquinone biosynthesis C-methylase UbiE